MRLDEYLFYSNQTQASFAKKIGIHRNYLCAMLAGDYNPREKLAKKIEKATHGHVTQEEAMNPPPPMIDLTKKRK